MKTSLLATLAVCAAVAQSLTEPPLLLRLHRHGPELLKWMHTINKKIPVITFSGIPYNNEHLAHLGAEYMFTKQEVIDGKADNVILQILDNQWW